MSGPVQTVRYSRLLIACSMGTWPESGRLITSLYARPCLICPHPQWLERVYGSRPLPPQSLRRSNGFCDKDALCCARYPATYVYADTRADKQGIELVTDPITPYTRPV